MSRDVRDIKDIPKVIRTILSRFFKSEEGMGLGWSEEEKERTIQKSIEGAKQVSLKSEQIQSSLGGSWTIDLKALFVEHVKSSMKFAALSSVIISEIARPGNDSECFFWPNALMTRSRGSGLMLPSI
ncbi:hypothetical protein [Nitrosomonas sp. Is37]|uniref:hypothetical protein n=1 Tax=Nitrosomonas sp. Is37 TaxID=3080535 RepID=UPI00294AE8EC|nr:hypothetical protein [Nitrosomonas sp. Is37]MDV6343025.1 hypothetical protein [Nitrosomonas sp. Is37]